MVHRSPQKSPRIISYYFIAGLEVFFPYDFIYKEQLNFMLELKVSAKQNPQGIRAPVLLTASAGCKG